MKNLLVALTVIALAMACPQNALAITITGDTADARVTDTGGVSTGGSTERIGMGNDQNWLGVYVFELPVLPDGEAILDADFSFKVVGGNDWKSLDGKGLDLYALRMSSASTVLGTDFYIGDYDSDASATGIQPHIFFQDEEVNQGNPPDSIMGTHSCDAVGKANLVTWLASCYSDPSYNPAGSNYVLLRINSRDVWGTTTYRYWTVGMANSAVEDEKPTLTIITASDLTAPIAEAGDDQSHTTDLSSNPVTVTLDGSASTPVDSAIASFIWTENDSQIASGEISTADLAVGVHTITLTVTDGEGDTDSDSLVVTILDGAPTPPVADAGADQSHPDSDDNGSESVTLDGSASYATFDGAVISAWSWTDGEDNVVATTDTATLTLNCGYHEFTLTVTDSNGLTDSDTMSVNVGREQLLNLPSDRPSFPVPTDIVWPETVGDPHICLWYGDKFAALSITIDDNILPQHAWWIQMANTYGFTPTWFIIVSGVENETNPSFSGVWDDYRDLSALGGDIQTHTMTHSSSDDVRPEEEVHYEYGQSQALIDANIPNNQCLTIGYPYGRGNIDIARQYFIAGRGTNGTPNKPAKINWMSTSSSSGRIDTDYVHPILYGTSGISWLNSTQWMRGWLCTHFHTVQDLVQEEARLAYVATLKDLIWWGSFGEVVRFGQERDSAEITVIENTATKIAFDLTDRMNDQIFNHPLTIKLRLPDEWNAQATATQNGSQIASEIKTNGDYDYILLDAIPDRGTVEITQSGNDKPGDANGDGAVNLDDFIILKQNYGSENATWSQGDFNGDSAVNLDDFIILKQNYGS